jgi:hypothetical protein
MPKSGPTQLAAYHQQVLDEESKQMHATAFNTEELDEETVAAANERLAKMAVPPIQLSGVNVPAPAPVQNVPEPPAPAPATSPAPPADPEPKPTRTRMTVGKMAQKYQERIEVLTSEITAAEKDIVTLQASLDGMRFKLDVWKEALAEIGAD